MKCSMRLKVNSRRQIMAAVIPGEDVPGRGLKWQTCGGTIEAVVGGSLWNDDYCDYGDETACGPDPLPIVEVSFRCVRCGSRVERLKGLSFTTAAYTLGRLLTSALAQLPDDTKPKNVELAIADGVIVRFVPGEVE